MVHGISMPPDHLWHCALATSIIWTATLCSTLLILNMTFERFYSIIRPHKAASFNTVKRAKITILLVMFIGALYNIPHLFITDDYELQCIPYGKVMGKMYGQFYYWFTIVVTYCVPFMLLLAMNSLIIHTLRKRSDFKATMSEGQGHTEGQSSKIKNSERQIYIMLLLVSFGFLIFTIPGYALTFYVNFVDYQTSAKSYAGFYLSYNVAQKLNYTNHGINFFLYVMSGHRFRSNLMNLFRRNKEKENGSSFSNKCNITQTTTASTL